MDIITDIQQLRWPCRAVASDDIEGLVDEMLGMIAAGLCQGLAANQVGSNLRIIVTKPHEGPPLCIINPVITKRKGLQKANERCLSLPGVIRRLKRPREIKIQGLNRYFNRVSLKFSNLEARQVCHEIDHLDGILITDYQEETDGADASQP